MPKWIVDYPGGYRKEVVLKPHSLWPLDLEQVFNTAKWDKVMELRRWTNVDAFRTAYWEFIVSFCLPDMRISSVISNLRGLLDSDWTSYIIADWIRKKIHQLEGAIWHYYNANGVLMTWHHILHHKARIIDLLNIPVGK